MAIMLKAPSEQMRESVRVSLLRLVRKDHVVDFAIRRVGEFNSLLMNGSVKEHEWNGGVSELSMALATSRKMFGKFVFRRQKRANRIFALLKELQPAPELIEGQAGSIGGQKSR